MKPRLVNAAADRLASSATGLWTSVRKRGFPVALAAIGIRKRLCRSANMRRWNPAPKTIAIPRSWMIVYR
jgi:hypothetical protein